MTVSATSPSAALSGGSASLGGMNVAGGEPGGAALASGTATTWDGVPAGTDDYGYRPVQPAGTSLQDLDDSAVSLASSDGRLVVRFEDGGDDGLKVTTTLDGAQLGVQHLGSGTKTFVMDGRQVTVDVDHYQTGTGSWMPGVGEDHHRARVSVTDLRDQATGDDDVLVAHAGIDDDETSSASGVMDDQQLAALVHQLTGTDVAGEVGHTTTQQGLLPVEYERERLAGSVFLGDYGVGVLEFGPDIADDGVNAPTMTLEVAGQNQDGKEMRRRIAGFIPPTGSVAIQQDNGLQTSFAWRFRMDGDRYVLDGVDVRSTGTDPDTGAAIDRSFTMGPSGDPFQAAAKLIGMTWNDYNELIDEFAELPGIERIIGDDHEVM